MSPLVLILSIMAINIAYVSIFTLRLILVIKGRRGAASFLAMAEVFIYLAGLNLVLNNLSDPIHMAAYCVGFGLGVYLGSRIEEYLALGYSVVQVITESDKSTLPDKLRGFGYGVTTWTADGRDGRRLVMQVLVKRSNERKLLSSIMMIAPKAFVISHEPRQFKGGFWAKMIER
jgi:uncharacterized protein YebE (UPF0316 family)